MTDAAMSTVPPPSQVHVPTSPGAGFWPSTAAVLYSGMGAAAGVAEGLLAAVRFSRR
jgi:hypothetical protein